ncbi:SpaN/EivJ family type III secretion system needle length determinant [Burkholderia sp. HI2714]|uniref:SpaN/EivJ family type III secretion system needle length determinant n=1 Tax=Burkholderia sp. HI2714 TaxID=2015359 RepID=UPI0015C5F7F6|nr:type III secretion system needle length determinant, SpaN/EivJ family [Burkholderia sp. HI2714]
MEAMIPIALPKDGATVSPDDTGSLMDSLLARREPRPRKEEERDRESAAEAQPWLPPLPRALAALRRNQLGQVTVADNPEGRSQSLVMRALLQDGGAAPHSRSAWPQAELSRSNAAVKPGAQGGKHPAALPEAARVVAASMAVADGGAVFQVGHIAAAPEQAALAPSESALPHPVERKPRHDALSLQAAPPQSAPSSRLMPFPSPQVRQEAAPGMPRHARSESAQAVDVPQSALTYRFSRWGGEHGVTVQASANGGLLLQPSDALVAQRLSEQWQSGNPQQWQLARDGGDGGEQRRPQQQEEDDV